MGENFILTLKINIGDLEISAVLDTASYCSLISEKIWKKSKYSQDSAFLSYKEDLILLLVKDKIYTRKINQVPIIVNRFMFPLDLHVTEMYDDLILGLDFLCQTEATIDFKRDIIVIKGEVIKLYRCFEK